MNETAAMILIGLFVISLCVWIATSVHLSGEDRGGIETEADEEVEAQRYE